MPTKRRANDFYPTPEFATHELLNEVDISGSVLEPCAGDGAISRVLDRNLETRQAGYLYASDIVGNTFLSFCGDATKRETWETIQGAMFNDKIDWVVTNPPFNRAAEIIPLAFEFAEYGIAMLLRLSFLEPTEDRGTWLNNNPPTRMIVLPRISFTGDGKTDSVTCAWMVWEKNKTGTIRIAVNPKFKMPANGGIKPLAEEGLFAA